MPAVISEEPWDSPDAQQLRLLQRAEVAAVYGLPDGEPKKLPGRGDVLVTLVARIDGAAVGCVVLTRSGPGAGEVKRMFVAPHHRGSGLSRQLLAAIEEHALGLGLTAVRLQTSELLLPARRLYESAGYSSTDPFPPYPETDDSLFYRKDLTR